MPPNHQEPRQNLGNRVQFKTLDIVLTPGNRTFRRMKADFEGPNYLLYHAGRNFQTVGAFWTTGLPTPDFRKMSEIFPNPGIWHTQNIRIGSNSSKRTGVMTAQINLVGNVGGFIFLEIFLSMEQVIGLPSTANFSPSRTNTS